MPALDTILARRGVEILRNEQNKIGTGQTKARKTLQKIVDRHGEKHLQDVLTCFLETDNNKKAMIAPVIKAVSALLLAQAEWWRRDTSAWLEVLDRVELARVHERLRKNTKAGQVDKQLVGCLFLELADVFSPREPELFDHEEERA